MIYKEGDYGIQNSGKINSKYWREEEESEGFAWYKMIEK